MERLTLRVIPNSRKDEVVGFEEGILKVKVRAVPEDGKANKAVVALLAKETEHHRRDFAIVSGQTARLKQICLPESAVRSLRKKVYD